MALARSSSSSYRNGRLSGISHLDVEPLLVHRRLAFGKVPPAGLETVDQLAVAVERHGVIVLALDPPLVRMRDVVQERHRPVMGIVVDGAHRNSPCHQISLDG